MIRLLLACVFSVLLTSTHSSSCYAQWPANQAKLAEQVEQLLKDNAIPGAVVLMRQGDQQWLQAFGVADLKTKQPMQTDMAFRVGSNTKTMTATVILQTQGQESSQLERTFELRNNQLTLSDGSSTQIMGRLASATDSQLVLEQPQGTLTFTRPSANS